MTHLCDPALTFSMLLGMVDKIRLIYKSYYGGKKCKNLDCKNCHINPYTRGPPRVEASLHNDPPFSRNVQNVREFTGNGGKQQEMAGNCGTSPGL